MSVLPIPGTDGMRMLFIIVGLVTRRTAETAYTNSVNGLGFLSLLLLGLWMVTP